MTRENKVALVVGFALVLFVGILVSDHLSKAQTQRTADLTPDAATPPAPTDRPARFVDLRTAVPPRQSRPVPVAPLTVTDEPQTVLARPAAVLEPVPAAERTYQVRHGESLSTICQQVYGTATLTSALATHNGIDNPDTVWAGRRLSLPEIDVLTGDTETTATPGGGERPVHQGAEWESYRIKAGDSLSDIAQRFMGSAGRWRQLYELNRHAISNPDDIRVGTVLKVPSG